MSTNEEVQNNQLAEEFQTAFQAELKRRNAPHLSVEVVNMGNVNIDIRVDYGNGMAESFFRYWGIGHLRRKIRKDGLDKVIADFVQGFIMYVQERADWDYRESSKMLKSQNLTESYKYSLELRKENSRILLERLKLVKGGEDVLPDSHS